MEDCTILKHKILYIAQESMYKHVRLVHIMYKIHVNTCVKFVKNTQMWLEGYISAQDTGYLWRKRSEANMSKY